MCGQLSFLWLVEENNRRYFLLINARWKRRSVDGFRTIAARTKPARAHEQRADAGDHAIAKPEARRTRPGVIEDQQLLLEEQRFGHDATHPARTSEPGDGRHEMKNQDAQIAHRTIVNNRAKSPKCYRIADSPSTGSPTPGGDPKTVPVG